MALRPVLAPVESHQLLRPYWPPRQMDRLYRWDLPALHLSSQELSSFRPTLLFVWSRRWPDYRPLTLAHAFAPRRMRCFFWDNDFWMVCWFWWVERIRVLLCCLSRVECDTHVRSSDHENRLWSQSYQPTTLIIMGIINISFPRHTFRKTLPASCNFSPHIINFTGGTRPPFACICKGNDSETCLYFVLDVDREIEGDNNV